MINEFLRRAWRRLPIDIPRKQRLQRRLFELFPWVFRHTDAYIAWNSHRDPSESLAATRALRDEPPVPLLEAPPLTAPPVQLIAFYLPQFHPIPENDAWWGRGFTEWTNVIRGKPRFPGHYQPHLPGELGFYDLRVPAIQHRQIELAKLYGVGGFAFYFYWFGGKTLLETPVRRFLDDDSLDFPFCLCWANENWSRRWDGRDHDLLIRQEHSADDDIAFIAYVSRYLRDRRYIRVKDRPLLIVYRPDLLPKPAETAARWRQWCRSNGLGEVCLACTQSFESKDPKVYGMDVAIEFPPNSANPPVITDHVDALDPEFRGIVFDWTVFPLRSRDYSTPKYPLYRGVNPSWDNEARRLGSGAIYLGSSPGGYREWLENATRDTIARFSEPSERLVFVNAWNEWAEGAHLEPDQRHGYAYLQATRDALQAARVQRMRKLLVVSHDARSHGAQYLALNLVRTLKENLVYRVHMIVLGDGALLEDFRALTSVDVLGGVPQDGARARSLAARLSADGFTDAIVNTTASGLFTRPLRDAGIRVVSLIHELPDLISAHGLRSHARTIAECADKIVFPAEPVRRGFERFTRLPDEKVVVRPQGLYKRNAIRAPSEREAARQRLRERIGVAPETEIVIGIGYGDRRKGLDLFVEAGTKVCAERAHVAFVWVGNLDLDLERAVLERICNAGLLSRFHFTGHETETDVFYAGADLYAMTSREDPFPSVVLEALEVGVPAVGFEGAGGFTALAAEHCVTLVPAFDTSAFARAVADMLEDDTRRNRAGAAGKAIISRDFGFRRYVFDLLSATSAPPPRVSVVVPNYNYRDYLQQRLASIVAQSVPVYEVIVLDDASTDGSREWLETELYKLFPEAQLIINDANSGSVFRQWLKGVQLARGEFVWIAEADDLAEPNFLEVALRGLSDPDVVLSYTQSKQIDGAGNVLASHYGEYVADISRERWEHQYITSGLAEIREALAIKNTIPNVSGVLFRRQPLVAVLSKHIDALVQYKVAGDWATYVELLGGGRVAFSPEPLNLHRRHDTSVTLSRFDLSQLTEIMRVQKQVRDRFDLDHEVRARAAAYAQELYEQFGLASESHPSIGKHPDLACLL